MPTDELTDSDSILVRRAVSGDEAAFTALFDRYYMRIREFGFRIVLDTHSADDVAQETFIQAARRLSSLRDGQAFEAWVYRIATNVARQNLRTQKALDRMLHEAAEVEASIWGGSAGDTSNRALLAMQSLPPKQRAAVALVIIDGLSHAQAAERLGCAETTVSWRIFRAKRTLRRKLKS